VSNLFAFISHPMELGLAWLALTVGSAGIGIILFTIAVRLVLSPLQIVQLRNAKSMQRLQPLMAEMRQKYGKDKQKLQEETMRLYKEHNVNPALGCLPMVLQFPVLIGLFYGLSHLGSTPTGYPHTIKWSSILCNGHHVSNLHQWVQSCYAVNGMSHTDKVFTLFHAQFLWLNTGLGLHDPLYILPVLAGITQWIQSRMMLTKSTDPQQQTMNFMMNFMPLMIVFFATRYASGLSLYWVTSTIIGIAIQYRITGLGLLTQQWPFNTLMAPATVPTQGGKKAGGQKGGSNASGAKPVAKTPALEAGPEMNLEPVDGSAAPEPNGGGNGNGNRNGNGGAAGNRPRRKANRARGGRSGGKRG
jgi:YidC/Oxa1 family membrane protein insertase